MSIATLTAPPHEDASNVKCPGWIVNGVPICRWVDRSLTNRQHASLAGASYGHREQLQYQRSECKPTPNSYESDVYDGEGAPLTPLDYLL